MLREVGRFRPRLPLLGLVLALAIAAASAGPAAAQVETPGRGSPLRAAILDALRPMVAAEVGPPVEFVVDQLRVLGPWAFVSARPQRPGGGAIDYSRTKYREAVAAGAFGDEAIALLHQTSGSWVVYEYSLGATDVPWVDWPDQYHLSPDLFPH